MLEIEAFSANIANCWLPSKSRHWENQAV